MGPPFNTGPPVTMQRPAEAPQEPPPRFTPQHHQQGGAMPSSIVLTGDPRFPPQQQAGEDLRFRGLQPFTPHQPGSVPYWPYGRTRD